MFYLKHTCDITESISLIKCANVCFLAVTDTCSYSKVLFREAFLFFYREWKPLILFTGMQYNLVLVSWATDDDSICDWEGHSMSANLF